MTRSSVKSIAFFDVDHTLVDGVVGLYGSLRLIQHGILKKRRLVEALYYKLKDKFKRIDVRAVYRIATKDMAGVSIERIYEIGRECVRKDVLPKLFPEGLQLIAAHRAKGHKIVLISSSPYMVIDMMREALELDAAYSSGPKAVDGILIDELVEPFCYKEGKVHYAELVAREYGVSLDECYFYTDDSLDLALMERVGHPKAVNPKKKLAEIAKARGWEILRFGKHAISKQ